jgi:hypothetical protein
VTTTSHQHGHEHAELLCLYALQALPREETARLQGQIAACAECQRELQRLRPVVDLFATWPTDLLRPSTPLWGRLAERVAAETGEAPLEPPAERWSEPEWENVAPGIWCKLLARDTEQDRISMLVRLEPGGEYPPHDHAGLEELHLLHGELWIDDRKLYAGDYNRAQVGTGDSRVWSETGCTCVLITSTLDRLR